MTALELILEVRKAGGTLKLIADRRLGLKNVPEHLISEIKRLKLMIIRHIEQENFERLKRVFNLKPVTARTQEITGDQPWRILSAKRQPEWQIRYRWQQVCHNGACDHAIETPEGLACSRCYPFANGGGGRLVHVTGKCTASIHALVKRKVDGSWAFFAEHMLWVPDQERKPEKQSWTNGPWCPGYR